ncbi:hypothetical protein CLHUN_02460 [Ruminiclostridium hungatei]|uniref:ClpX-type ZB domain-containing protein n=1 Tax=Ruminiclostridium hungatei TaxID=48256 RepID=A0A1V4SRC3_RUMHU|nr:hypothetical protein [Ruminiclostridium hungatei]OPX46430.1 hypothetical protein CLHUN_02460 [Ruminiclostridium hungatei]
MNIKKKNLKDPPDFCFCCGRRLEITEYVLDLGTAGSTFELCRSCLNRLKIKAEKALIKDGPG